MEYHFGNLCVRYFILLTMKFVCDNGFLKSIKLIYLLRIPFFVNGISGRPLPQVTWWRDNVLLNTTSIQILDKKVKNTLQLNRLERKDLHNSYVCQASNNDVSHPLTSSVTLDLNCKYAATSLLFIKVLLLDLSLFIFHFLFHSFSCTIRPHLTMGNH
jgi:hypothetical protein